VDTRSVAALLLAAALAAPLAAQARARPFLPLADGSRWTLTTPDGVGRTTMSVRGATLHGLPGAGPLRVRAAGASVQAWDAAQRRWEPFLRLGAPRGSRYVVDLSGTLLWQAVEVTVATRAARVRDARGRLHVGAVRLVVRPRKPIPDAGIAELVFARGVGPVRIVEQTIAGERVLLLRSHRIG
jgi:hypothetical protein